MRLRRELTGALLLAALVVCSVGASGHGQATTKPKPTGAEAPERAIRVLGQRWLKAVAAKDVEKIVLLFADDGSALYPGMPIATGRAAIRKAWSGMFSSPGYVSLTFAPSKIEAAQSADMVYEIGSYELTTKDANGQTKSEKGKYVTVWERQKGGSWRVEADIFNADQ